MPLITTLEIGVVLAALALLTILIFSKSPQMAPSPTLRPQKLEDFVGQEGTKQVISVMTRKGRLSDHLLLVGPAGTGKTTLAYIAAGQARLHVAIGGQLRTPVAMERAIMRGRDMLFIDEIHAASRRALEILYTALEDQTLHTSNGGTVRLQQWRLLAGTTDSGKLPAPLRDRFGQIIYLSYYSLKETSQIIKRSAKLLGVPLTSSQIGAIARRSRGVPRVANTLLQRVADFSDGGKVELAPVWEAL